MPFAYETEQWLPVPVEVLFGFFSNPANLPRLMPAWQKARIEDASIVAPPRAETASRQNAFAAGAGSRITLSFRPFPYAPFRVSWEAEIDEFAWNDHFCDRQSRGPFAHWKHCHRVEAVIRDGISGTLITDHVEYELPFGTLGRLAHTLGLRREIEGMFTFRQASLAELLSRLHLDPRNPVW